MFRFLTIGIALWFMSVTAPYADRFMLVTDKTAPAPIGMRTLCATVSDPVICSKKEPRSIKLAASADTLLKVNRRINEAIKAMPESSEGDIWQLGTLEGDCDEFATAKILALVASGIPREALSLAAVQVGKSRDLHAVVLVSTDQGDYVLDNLTADIVQWDLIPDYRFLARESADDPLVWELVF